MTQHKYRTQRTRLDGWIVMLIVLASAIIAVAVAAAVVSGVSDLAAQIQELRQ